MDNEILTLASISTDISTWIVPFVQIGFTFVLILMTKDWLTSIAQGLLFSFNPTFNESDVVFLDGERAIIVKLGLLTTVFGISKPDGTYCWRYVPNTKVNNLKLEKIINLDNMKLPKINTDS